MLADFYVHINLPGRLRGFYHVRLPCDGTRSPIRAAVRARRKSFSSRLVSSLPKCLQYFLAISFQLKLTDSRSLPKLRQTRWPGSAQVFEGRVMQNHERRHFVGARPRKPPLFQPCQQYLINSGITTADHSLFALRSLLWYCGDRLVTNLRRANVTGSAFLPRNLFPEVLANHLVAALFGFDEALNFALPLLRSRLFFLILHFPNEMPQQNLILNLPQQKAIGRKPVAPRSARFLVILFDRFRQR